MNDPQHGDPGGHPGGRPPARLPAGWPLLLAIALVIGLLAGGVGGGVASLLIAGDDEAAAPAAVAAAAPAGAGTGTAVAHTASLADAIARVLPAVVTVVAELPDRVDAQGRVIGSNNIGSGIVVTDAGHVLTNFHIVQDAERVIVVLSTGERREALVVGSDAPYTDMAVLQVAPGGLRRAELGSARALRPGDPVAAIAGGLISAENKVTTGVISALGVPWPRIGVVLEDLVQTDAAVNHGDSGGALVTAAGEVVGLLTTVVRLDPAARAMEGVAFAQSTDSLGPAIDSIIATGSFPRPRPGIEQPGRHHVEVTASLAQELALPVAAGALLTAVEPGSPAAAVGLAAGDIVVGVNGRAIDSSHPLVNLLKPLPAAGSAELLIVRDGREIVVTVPLA